MKALRIRLALVAALSLAAPVHAGQIVDPSTGSIVGIVRDVTGAVLQGVDIMVSSQALMASRNTSTGPDGAYLVVGLPPGDYTLAYSLQGFRAAERTVRVSVAFTATVDVALGLASQRAEITVSGQGSVLDRHSAAIADTFDSRQLADLPSSRSLAGLVALTQGMFMPSIEVGGGLGLLAGSFSAYGKNSSPRHTLEGIIVTGLFGFGFTPDYGAFAEVSVLTAAHGAEWPTAGIHTEMVTKSGGNRYTGTFYGAYENRAWQSTNVDAGQVARFAPSGGGLSAGQVNQVWRYHDANADVGGFVLRDRLWWYGSIRDQETAARVVNFPVGPSRTRLTNYSGKATYQPAPGHTFVVFGQRGRNEQPFRLDPSGVAGNELSPTTAINLSVGSTGNQRSSAWVWKGEWQAAVSNALLFNVRVGQFGTGQNFRSRSRAPRFEDIETLVVSGGNRDSQFDATRNQLFGTLNYFKAGWFGSHHFKAGGEAIRFLTRDAWSQAFPGNMVHVLKGGGASSVVFLSPSTSTNGIWTFAGYVADSWRLQDRLTLSLGLRFDRYRLYLPAQEHVDASGSVTQFETVPNLADWNTVVPRIAAVYDLTGTGTTLVKGSYARYRPAPNAGTASNSNPNPPVWSIPYTWTDGNGSGVWEPGEEVRIGRRRGGVAVESLDPALDLAIVDEVGTWIERELPAGIGLRSGIVWRRERSPFTRQNANQPYEAFTVPVTIRDPGPDGVPGTTDDGGTFTAYDLRADLIGVQAANVVRNIPGASSAYTTWEVDATRRTRGRWSLGAGFSYTWNSDQASGYSGQAARGNPYPLTPNDLINTGAGGRHNFTTWTATAHGTYQAPWGVRVTPVLRHQSGQPFGRTFTTGQLEYSSAVTVLAEPIGSRRMDNITIVDLRVEKRLPLNGNLHLSGFLDVFNCFNANPEQNVIWSSGSSFLRPLSIVSPRIAQVGVTLEW
jgi:outer membrane receptor protein involved in Fe transport